MNLTNIDHIGIAVKNLEDSVKLYERLLGIKCYAIEEVREHLVRTAFFLIGQTKIELLEPTAPDSPICAFIDRHGEGIHHIAFAVEDTDKALANAKVDGFRLIDNVSRKGAEGMDIGFLNPKSTKGVLIEFCSHSMKYDLNEKKLINH